MTTPKEPTAHPLGEATGSALCKHCGGEIAIRNPTGKCDHLYWPDMLTDEAKRANGFRLVTRQVWECDPNAKLSGLARLSHDEHANTEYAYGRLNMASVNRVILVARLGKDPEIRTMSNGKSVANFSVATSETWKDKNTGQKQEKSEWHNIVAYDKLADIIGQYLRKGSQVYLEGRLQTRKWQDKEGKDRYTTEIICNEMQMLDGKRDAGGSSAVPAPVNQSADGGGGTSEDYGIPF